MTHTEPEQLALRIRELIERQAVLKAALEGSLQKMLTDRERADIERVLDRIGAEMGTLEQRLESLRDSGKSAE